ncbi:MAG: DMT family transporter [SAR324 cluster bacterium]|nr:DMT family transporter [SAR324 cluster bacterium]
MGTSLLPPILMKHWKIVVVSPYRTALLSFMCLVAFAANSVLCRLALKNQEIGAIEFTFVRVLSGSIALFPIFFISLRRGEASIKSGYKQALALFGYAIFFSLAYVRLETGTGALILFGSVQITMIGISILRGNRLSITEWIGLIITFSGVIYLLAPNLNILGLESQSSIGLAPPPLVASLFMLASGISWSFYSVWGQNASNPSFATARNFLLSAPLALLGLLFLQGEGLWTVKGVMLAATSGAVTSGLGYLTWYVLLKNISLSTAALLQLSVPMVAALGGVLLLGELITVKIILSSLLILGGIFLSIWAKVNMRKQASQNLSSKG